MLCPELLNLRLLRFLDLVLWSDRTCSCEGEYSFQQRIVYSDTMLLRRRRSPFPVRYGYVWTFGEIVSCGF